MQGHPPGKSSVPRESLLKRIICDLLPDALMLTQMLQEATYCIIIRYTYKLLSPNFSVSHEFRSSNASPAKSHVEKNWRSVRVKGSASRRWADWGAIISFSKYSSTNFSHVRPSWLLSSKLFTSVFCWSAQFRLFLDTPQSSSFRHFSSSLIVSTSIHQERAVFLVTPFSMDSCDHLWFVAWRSGVHSKPIPCGHPLP